MYTGDGAQSLELQNFILFGKSYLNNGLPTMDYFSSGPLKLESRMETYRLFLHSQRFLDFLNNLFMDSRPQGDILSPNLATRRYFIC